MSSIRETLELLSNLVGIVSGLSDWESKCPDTKTFLVLWFGVVLIIILEWLCNNKPRDR